MAFKGDITNVNGGDLIPLVRNGARYNFDAQIIIDSGSGVSIVREEFTPMHGQTVFTLSNSLTSGQKDRSQVFLNGQKLHYIGCYTIAGTQLTIILPYDLEIYDLLEIYY